MLDRSTFGTWHSLLHSFEYFLLRPEEVFLSFAFEYKFYKNILSAIVSSELNSENSRLNKKEGLRFGRSNSKFFISKMDGQNLATNFRFCQRFSLPSAHFPSITSRRGKIDWNNCIIHPRGGKQNLLQYTPSSRIPVEQGRVVRISSLLHLQIAIYRS